MTPTLSPQQREEVLEAMARAVCRYDGHNPDELWDIGAHAKFEAPEPAWHSYTDDIDPLVDVLWDAALPAIIGEVLERAAQCADQWSVPSNVKLAAGEMTAQELRTAQAVAGGIAAALRALAEEAR